MPPEPFDCCPEGLVCYSERCVDEAAMDVTPFEPEPGCCNDHQCCGVGECCEGFECCGKCVPGPLPPGTSCLAVMCCM